MTRGAMMGDTRHSDELARYERNILPVNKIANVRRRVLRARRHPTVCVTCPASRHLHIMADALSGGREYHMLREEPIHCAGTMYAVLESLWKARAELARLKGGAA